ncbi:hypothetical protein K438DRAFT_1982832 [Mycena galopus ATCC 62051]|nr:hypothetical protein K438DRAFT_1982832 [Mycena galopus ATCC 62051]
MSSSPAKPQRPGDASITRSDVWFKDGSVVLQAAGTQFRVHWSILSLHSSFFRDLEDLPQPPDQPTIDGCPIVELQDTVEDVEYLLKGLQFLNQTALPFAVGALIRLGRKYDFKHLLDSAVACIIFENPTTLEKYDALNVDAKYKPTRIIYSHSFYWDVAELHDSRPRDDGTLASLPSVDLRRCLLGRETLLTKQFQTGYTLGWLREWPYADCNDPKCGAMRKKLFHLYMDQHSVGSFIDFTEW